MQWRFLLRPRWLLGHVLVISVVALMLSLSAWQFDRLGERKEANAALLAARQAPVLELPATSGPVGEFRSLRAEGNWVGVDTVYVRYPAQAGRPGYYVLMPLRLSDGTALVVNRGWIPLDEGKDDSLPSSQDGDVAVTGVARYFQDRSGEAGATEGAPPVPTVTAIDQEQLAASWPGLRLRPYWLQADAALAGGAEAVPVPEVSEGSHFAYALQWIGFSAVALIGWGILLYRMARER